MAAQSIVRMIKGVPTLILLGKYLEAVDKGKTSEAIKKLMGLQAKTARVIRNGAKEDIPIEDASTDDEVVIMVEL